MPADPLLVFRNVIKRRTAGRGYVLSVEDLTVSRPSRLALIGDSGSGKSTLLDLMALILKPDEAESFLWSSGEKTVDLEAAWQRGGSRCFEAIRRSSLGYVMQTGGLLPFLTAEANILLPGELKGTAPKERREFLAHLAEVLKITSLLKRKPAQLSVGQRQRCAIARALIHQPDLILADEPTASLDPPTARQVLELLLELSSDRALVISTHNLELIRGRGFTVFQIVCQDGGPGEPVTAKAVPLEDNWLPQF
ncbi:MAG: ATP-binding cassette domain-containing protein [Deltaproteobacteria bacterium]|jgi:putative ABC transport system ATP-binding protein|nr:ATP-binding cassette domain-containing protein [Deltaproteobacteria bacterium]